MPLKKGKGVKIIGSNIGELMSTYEKTRKIGESRPKNSTDAVRQAAAIAYKTAGRPLTKRAKSMLPRAFKVGKKKDGNRPVKFY